MKQYKWHEDDTPRDLSKYSSMSEAEIDAEIERLEKEHREAKDHGGQGKNR